MANARLVADLYANTTPFEKGMNKAKVSLNQFGSVAKTAGLAAVTAFGGVGLGLGMLAKKQAEVIDQTNKLARTLGVNVGNFQAMSLVADEAGVSQEQLAVAFTKTQKAIYDAASGSKAYTEAFDTIGLKARDLIDLKPDEQFAKIAEALSSIENPTQRTALAIEIFGKSGRGVIDMLDNFKGRSLEAKSFLDKFNITLNEIDGRKVEEANDAFARLSVALTGVGNTIAVQLAPLITAVANRILDVDVNAQTMTNSVRNSIDSLVGVFEFLRQSYNGALITLKSMEVVVRYLTKTRPFDAEQTKKNIEGLKKAQKELGDLSRDDGPTLIGSVEKARYEADQRAFEAAMAQKKKSSRSLANSLIADNEEVSKSAKKASDERIKETESAIQFYQDLRQGIKDTTYTIDEFAKSSNDAFNTFVGDITRGGDALQALRNLAATLIQDVLNNINGNQQGGGLGGLLAKGLSGAFGNLFGGGAQASALSAAQRGISNPALFGPGFATGIESVPYDMNARIHKGEMIIPAQQAATMRRAGSGGSVSYNIDARGAERGVEEKIRGVLLEVQKLRRDTPRIAVSSVADQNRRNPEYLR